MRIRIAVLLLVISSVVFADWVIMTPEEQELNDRFPALATHDDAVTAFNGRHFLLQQKAVQWFIVHRDIATARFPVGKFSNSAVALYWAHSK